MITIYTRRKSNENNNTINFTNNFQTNSPIQNDENNSFKDLYRNDNIMFNNESIHSYMNKISGQNFETDYEMND